MRTAIPSGRQGAGYISDSVSDGTRLFGPQLDHSTGEPTGKYFWFGKSMDSRLVDTLYKTQLIINDLPPNGFNAQCLKFWYTIGTSTVQSFYIYVVPVDTVLYTDPKWTVPYNRFDRWIKGQVSINANYRHKIVFSLYLSREAPDTEFIALDDISLTSGQCEPPVSCDFDLDMCSWMNLGIYEANWNWVKFTGK